MERFAFDFLFFAVFVFFDKTVFHQFLFDLHQIIGGECNVQRILDGLQMVNLRFGFRKLDFKSFGSPFQFLSKYFWEFSRAVFCGSNGIRISLLLS